MFAWLVSAFWFGTIVGWVLRSWLFVRDRECANPAHWPADRHRPRG
jgi:hypothetical protein